MDLLTAIVILLGLLIIGLTVSVCLAAYFDYKKAEFTDDWEN